MMQHIWQSCPWVTLHCLSSVLRVIVLLEGELSAWLVPKSLPLINTNTAWCYHHLASQ